MSKEENIIKYYVLCNKLKNLIREGWIKWGVNRDRLESVAEHVCGVQQLALAIYSEFEYDIDFMKVMLMLAVHELEETIIKDLTEFDISSKEKEEMGHKAVEEVLSSLLIKEDIKKIILEFDERKTKEAQFAYYCDKLECDIQCKLYDEEKCVDMNKQQNNKIFYNEKVQKIISDGNKEWSDMWIEYDRDKFKDENFIKILNYVKTNKIS